MKNNVIPPMVDDMGRYWDQPSVNQIVIDDTHALMTRQTFEQLKEYSGTMPSGVYEGKMWRRHDGIFDPRCRPSDRRWLLMWYGKSTNPNKCSINSREVLIA